MSRGLLASAFVFISRPHLWEQVSHFLLARQSRQEAQTGAFPKKYWTSKQAEDVDDQPSVSDGEDVPQMSEHLESAFDAFSFSGIR